jgi:hypothetical protein
MHRRHDRLQRALAAEAAGRALPFEQAMQELEQWLR